MQSIVCPPLSKRGVWMNKNAYLYLIVFTHLKRIHKKLIKWTTCRAWAKTLQSCPTLCDPMDCSPSGSPVHGILQAWILEWGAISSSGDLPSQGSSWHLLHLLHSVHFSHSVVSDSLRHHGLQHTRPLCPSPAPRAYPNSCPLSRWCHPTISSSVIPFSHLQSFPASGSFPMSQFFTSGGQSIGVSALASVLPMNI